MRTHLSLVLFVFVLFCSCKASLQVTGDEKLAPEAAKEDITLLKKILEKKHPSLYWYAPKPVIDSVFQAALNAIADSVTEHRMRNIIAAALSQVRCGHTAVRYSKPYQRFLSKTRYPQFPLSIKTWKDSMVVINNYLNDSLIKRGTIITSINGTTPKQLLDSMFALISTDGYADNFKSQLISFNFPLYYRATFGLSKQYNITYIDSGGSVANATLSNFKPIDDSVKKDLPRALPPDKPRRKQRQEALLLSKRSLRIDTTTSTAYMNIATFSSGKLRKFFRKSFRAIAKTHTQSLVIELRLNGGGSIGVSNSLARYLKNTPFKISDTTAAIDRSLKYNAYAKPSSLYWLAMLVTSHKEADKRYHFGFMENYYYKPRKRHHFDGDIYIIQGGFTFSAASMFVHQLKHQKNVTIVGEESGGGAYGNNAVHLPEYYLPNSKLRVVIPAYRIVFNSKALKAGTGIIPEVEVPPASILIRQDRDLKIEVVEELIRRKREKIKTD